MTIVSDHSSLKWLTPHPNLTSRLARWSLLLQDLDFNIVHKPGVSNKVPDNLSPNPMPSCDTPMDILPEYAVIGGLYLHALPPVIFSDREHIRQLQLNDPVTGELIRMLKEQEQSDTGELSQYIMHDDLLYFKDGKVPCSLHPLKQLKLYAPTAIRRSLLEYYHDHPTAGHLGTTKTVARLKHRFFGQKCRWMPKST